MKNRKLDRSEWERELAKLSEEEYDWDVILETFHPELGYGVIAEHVPLLAVDVDVKDGRDDAVLISWGPEPDLNTHAQYDPVEIWLALDEDGHPTSLEVISKDGSKVFATFHGPYQEQAG